MHLQVFLFFFFILLLLLFFFLPSINSGQEKNILRKLQNCKKLLSLILSEHIIVQMTIAGLLETKTANQQLWLCWLQAAIWLSFNAYQVVDFLTYFFWTCLNRRAYTYTHIHTHKYALKDTASQTPHKLENDIECQKQKF